MQKKHSALLFSFLLIFIGLSACSSNEDKIFVKPDPDPTLKYVGNSPVVFTEIDSRNSVYKDNEGNDPGWAELYNQADTAVNLKGLSVLDAYTPGNSWTFGNVIVPPKSYIIVFFSGRNIIDAQNPSDTINMVGSSCWGWADSQNTPIAGTSMVAPLHENFCYNTELGRHFSARMQHGQNTALGWSSTSLFVATKLGAPENTIDISATNELVLTGYLPKNLNLELRLAQPDIEDYEGWFATLKGTGDLNSTYRILMPQNTSFPDLANIYGTRFAPVENEMKPVEFEFYSYIARNRGGEAHTSFKLNKSGGSLYLVNQKQEILDSVAYPELPPQKTWSKGDSFWGYADATPNGAVLGTLFTEKLGAVELPPSGFYTEPFVVTFPENQGETVRCELGGFAPQDTSAIYAEPIAIEKSTVLRCAQFKEGVLSGEIVSRTYLFEKQPSIATVFLTGNPLSFFSPDSGIYEMGPNASDQMPNYGANFWEDRELPIHIDLVEANAKTPAFSLNAGYKIFGNYSRSQKKKSVAITFREQYGENRLKYPLFPDYPEAKIFKGFILRNGGNSFALDYIRDMVASSISKGLNVDYQKGRASIVFYNGKYYGIHNIRERSNEYYFETNYNLEPKAIDLLKANNAISSGSAQGYIEMINWIEANGVVSDENFQHISSLMDIDNYLNYTHTEIFNNNRDWPANNLKKWRNTSPLSRWRWFLYDQDFGWDYLYADKENLYNVFDFVTKVDGPEWPNGPKHTLLLRKLLENASFKSSFINRYTTLLSMNFETARLVNRIDELMAPILNEIPRDQDRWLNNWEKQNMEKQQDVIIRYANTRQAASLLEMQEFFGLPAIKEVTLESEGPGAVAVHQLPLDRTSMTIKFFEGFPVLLTAVPNGGGVFKEWSDGVKEVSRTIDPASINELKAIFR